MRTVLCAALLLAAVPCRAQQGSRGEPATERYDQSRYSYSDRDMRKAQGMLEDEASYASLDKKTQYLIAQKLADKLRRARAHKKKWRVVKSGRKWTLKRSRSKVKGVKIKDLKVEDEGLDEIRKLNPGLKDIVVEREWRSETPGKPPVMESKQVESEPLTKLFADNDWEVLPESESAEALVELVEKIVDEMGPKGMVTGMTIRSSASKLPNTGKAAKYSFLELSRRRAYAARDFVLGHLKDKYGIDIPKDKVIILPKGDNGDGTSGPDYPTEGMSREDYDQFKYVQVDMDAMGMAEQPGEDGESDMSAQVVSAVVQYKSKRFQVSLPRIKLRRAFHWSKRHRRGGRKFRSLPCPAYD